MHKALDLAEDGEKTEMQRGWRLRCCDWPARVYKKAVCNTRYAGIRTVHIQVLTAFGL
jgi:hypothetical protein